LCCYRLYWSFNSSFKLHFLVLFNTTGDIFIFIEASGCCVCHMCLEGYLLWFWIVFPTYLNMLNLSAFLVVLNLNWVNLRFTVLHRRLLLPVLLNFIILSLFTWADWFILLYCQPNIRQSSTVCSCTWTWYFLTVSVLYYFIPKLILVVLVHILGKFFPTLPHFRVHSEVP
jgi:hypothetical protein